MADTVKIPIEVDLKGKALPDIKRELDLVKQSLNDMRRAGLENTEAFKSQLSVGGQLKTRYTELAKEQRNFGEATKMSKFQLWEFGENIAVVAAGMLGAIKLIGDFTKKLYDIALAGAEFGVLKENFDRLNGGIENANKNLELFRKASSGNLDDKEIIKLSNTMQVLGYTTKEQAQMFDLSERASDTFGTSIEESNNMLLRFFETGRGKTLYQMGIDINLVNDKVEQYAKSLGTTTKELTAEQQQTIRARITFEEYGDSLVNINKKQQDNADKLAGLTKAVVNFKDAFGNAMASVVVGSASLDETTKKAGELGDKVGSLAGILINVSSVFNSYFNPLTAPFILAYDAVMKLKSALVYFGIGSSGKVYDAGMDNTIKNALERNKQKKEEYDLQYSINERIAKQEIENRKLPKSVSTGSKGSDNLKEDEATIQKIISATKEEIENLKWKNLLNSESFDLKLKELETNKGLIKDTKDENDYLTAQNELIKERIKLVFGRGLTGGTFQGDTTPEREAKTYEKTIPKEDPFTSILNLQTAIAYNNALVTIGDSFQSLFQGITEGGDNSVSAWNNFLKSIVNSFITSIQAMILAASAALLAKGITTFGISLIADSPMLAAAWLALEAAKGVIAGFSTGGLFRGAGGVDNNLIAVTDNEYIVNPRATAKWKPFLDMINFGDASPTSNNYGRYANGGIVSGSGSPNITVIVQSELERAKAVRTLYNVNKEVDYYTGRKNT